MSYNDDAIEGQAFVLTSYELQGKSGAQVTLRVRETGMVIPIVTAFANRLGHEAARISWCARCGGFVAA